MFSGLFTLLQILFPFIKESLLKGTLREWIKRNKLSVAWICLLLIMLTIVMWLAESLLLSHHQAQRATQAANIYQLRHSELQQRYLMIEADHKRLRMRVSTLQNEQRDTVSLLEMYEYKAKRYDDWLRHCGAPSDFDGPGFPACGQTPRTRAPPRARPTPVTIPTDPAPVVEEVPDRKGFFNRLRGILGGGKDESDPTE